MSETLSEFEGCTHLSRLFRRRGYTIERNVMFREYGVEFHIDGWDKKARVGFEYLTSEDDDHDDLDVEEFQALSDAQLRGELAVFIIDEVEPVSTAALLEEASEFLDEVQSLRPLRKARPENSKKKKIVKKKKLLKNKSSKKTIKKPVKKVTKKKIKKKASPARKPIKKKAAKKKQSATKAATKKTAKKKSKKKATKKRG
ncbi:MAG: hypothetical protein HN985_09890 [Planctomycetaceae bacterium]|nr:hypothetical protein [Planctomycetaceae bacterium]MBT6920023.1 hypothetical protein [Planctomycetaceae bacterium]